MHYHTKKMSNLLIYQWHLGVVISPRMKTEVPAESLNDPSQMENSGHNSSPLSFGRCTSVTAHQLVGKSDNRMSSHVGPTATACASGGGINA